MTQNLTPGLNYFFYGLNENKNREIIIESIKKTSGAVFLPWVIPSISPMDINIYKKKNEHEIDHFIQHAPDKDFFDKSIKDKKTKKKIDDILGAHQGTKYLIFDSVHFIAHSNNDPEKYYNQLLSFCNYHYHNNSIHFIVSCGRVPVVFERENTLRHLWEFVDCSPFYGDTSSEDVGVSDNLLGFIEKILGNCPSFVREPTLNRLSIELDLLNDKNTKEKYSDYKKYCENPSLPLEASPETLNLSCIVEKIPDSYQQFDSDVYLTDSQSGFKVNRISNDIKEKFKEIIGQESAIQSLIDNVLISQNPIDEAFVAKNKRPLGVFLFVGSSGVGKTHVSQILKEVLLDYRFLQINLGECPDQESVNKLIGIGKGYVDSEQGGILTEAVRLHSRYVLLFDELDQAHAAVGELFYKIFEGEVKDGRGRKVSFKDCYIIMTTNKGYIPNLKEVSRSRYERRGLIEAKLKEKSEDRDSRLTFSDAFLGRIKDIIHFNELSVVDLGRVAKGYFDNVIRTPYKRNFNTKFEFVVSGMASGSPPGLMAEIVTPENLFFELWALKANINNKQGARRLFQVMDEDLIHSLELYRVNQKSEPKSISFMFTPANSNWGDRLDTASLVLIDDDESAVDTLKEALSTDAIKVDRCDFSELDDKVKYADIIMLDLLDATNNAAGVDSIREIHSINKSVPIIIYTSLEDSLLTQNLQNANCDKNIFGFVTKGGSAEDLQDVVFSAIRHRYLASNANINISELVIKWPHMNSPNLVFELSFEKGEEESN